MTHPSICVSFISSAFYYLEYYFKANFINTFTFAKNRKSCLQECNFYMTLYFEYRINKNALLYFFGDFAHWVMIS